MNKEDIFNKDIYKVTPMGASSSEKYNEMVDTLVDAVTSMSKDINDSEAMYHKDNIIRKISYDSIIADINNLKSTMDGINKTIFNHEDDENNLKKMYINIGSAKYTYGPIGSSVDLIEVNERSFIDRYSGMLLPNKSKYVSKLSMFDAMSGKTILSEDIATVTYPMEENVAFSEDLKYLYDNTSNKWMAVTRYSNNIGKLTDYIDIHIDIPQRLVSSYIANNITVETGISGMYDVIIVLNSIDGNSISYSYDNAPAKIDIKFADIQAISADIRLINNSPDNTIYDAYTSFMFVVNNIDINYIKYKKSKIYIEGNSVEGKKFMSISDIYSVDSDFKRIYNDGIRFSAYYFSETDGNAYYINNNPVIPYGSSKIYILVEYLDENLYEFIDNIIIEYKTW